VRSRLSAIIGEAFHWATEAVVSPLVIRPVDPACTWASPLPLNHDYEIESIRFWRGLRHSPWFRRRSAFHDSGRSPQSTAMPALAPQRSLPSPVGAVPCRGGSGHWFRGSARPRCANYRHLQARCPTRNRGTDPRRGGRCSQRPRPRSGAYSGVQVNLLAAAYVRGHDERPQRAASANRQDSGCDPLPGPSGFELRHGRHSID